MTPIRYYDATIPNAEMLLEHFDIPGPLATPNSRPDVLITTPRHLARPIGDGPPRAWHRVRGYFLRPLETILLDRGACRSCGDVGPLRADWIRGRLTAWHCRECTDAVDCGAGRTDRRG